MALISRISVTRHQINSQTDRVFHLNENLLLEFYYSAMERKIESNPLRYYYFTLDLLSLNSLWNVSVKCFTSWCDRIIWFRWRKLLWFLINFFPEFEDQTKCCSLPRGGERVRKWHVSGQDFLFVKTKTRRMSICFFSFYFSSFPCCLCCVCCFCLLMTSWTGWAVLLVSSARINWPNSRRFLVKLLPQISSSSSSSEPPPRPKAASPSIFVGKFLHTLTCDWLATPRCW